MMFSEFELYYF